MGVKDSILYNSKMYVHTVWANWRRVWVLIAVFVIALLIFSFCKYITVFLRNKTIYTERQKSL